MAEAQGLLQESAHSSRLTWMLLLIAGLDVLVVSSFGPFLDCFQVRREGTKQAAAYDLFRVMGCVSSRTKTRNGIRCLI